MLFESCGLAPVTPPSSIFSIYHDTTRSRVMFFHPIRISAGSSLTRSHAMKGQSPALEFEIWDPCPIQSEQLRIDAIWYQPLLQERLSDSVRRSKASEQYGKISARSIQVYPHSFAKLGVVICGEAGISLFTKGERNVTTEEQRRQSVTKIFVSKAM